MCVWERLSEEEFWKEFLDYKIEKQHLMGKDLEVIEIFIESKKYLDLIGDIRKQDYIPPIPFKNPRYLLKKRLARRIPIKRE